MSPIDDATMLSVTLNAQKLMDSMSAPNALLSAMAPIHPLKRSLMRSLSPEIWNAFDHLEIAKAGKVVVIFVTRGDQVQVLKARQKNFPPKSLLASLILMGS